MEYDKQLVILEMVSGSISALVSERFASAITLAGAVEPLIPELPDGRDLFSGTRDLLEGKYDVPGKKIADELLNYARNGLKHDKEDFDWSRIGGEEALRMVCRAYFRFEHRYPDSLTSEMNTFRQCLEKTVPGSDGDWTEALRTVISVLNKQRHG